MKKYLFQIRSDWLWTTPRKDPEVKPRLQWSAKVQGTCSVWTGHRSQGSLQAKVTPCVHAEDSLQSAARDSLSQKRVLNDKQAKTRASKSSKVSKQGRKGSTGGDGAGSASSGTALTPAWLTPRRLQGPQLTAHSMEQASDHQLPSYSCLFHSLCQQC